MTQTAYTPGLQDLGGDIYAYLQPDGSWGLNNAGLVVHDEKALLVDTLYDLPTTRKMVSAMQAVTPAARNIETVVNTHVNGDHCFGNQLFPDAEIIAAKACAEEFGQETPPGLMTEMLAAAPEMGTLGTYFTRCFGRFDFSDIILTPPTRTFEGRMDIQVGQRMVDLIEVGPCHTKGDILVHIPDENVLFAGDLLFVNAMPIMWEGPVANWIRACDLMLELKPRTIVPGHGPITDTSAVETTKTFWRFLQDQVAKYHAAGKPAAEAALEMVKALPEPYASWGDTERLAINVAAMYRELDHDPAPLNRVALFDLMARIAMAD